MSLTTLSELPVHRILDFCDKRSVYAFRQTSKTTKALVDSYLKHLLLGMSGFLRVKHPSINDEDHFLTLIKLRIGPLNSPLSHYVVFTRRYDSLFRLIELLGHKIDGENKEKNTLLHRATVYGTARLVQILIEYGWSPQVPNCHGNSSIKLLSFRVDSSEKTKIKDVFEKLKTSSLAIVSD